MTNCHKIDAQLSLGIFQAIKLKQNPSKEFVPIH